jgi:hypothetical protein
MMSWIFQAGLSSCRGTYGLQASGLVARDPAAVIIISGTSIAVLQEQPGVTLVVADA